MILVKKAQFAEIFLTISHRHGSLPAHGRNLLQILELNSASISPRPEPENPYSDTHICNSLGAKGLEISKSFRVKQNERFEFGN